MAQKKHTINVDKMRQEIQDSLGKKVSKLDLKDMLCVSRTTLEVWGKKAPDVVTSLMKYNEITGLPIESIIKEVD